MVALTTWAPGPAVGQAPHRPDLDARLFAEHPGDPFYSVMLNRPAYVAVFDVVPGEHVRLLVPRHLGAAVRLETGVHAVSRPWYTRSFPVASWSARGSRHATVGYLVLIASRDPLDLEALRSRVVHMGLPAFRSTLMVHGTAFSVMDRLVERVVASPAEGSWSIDWIPYWIPADPPPHVQVALASLRHALPRPDRPSPAPDPPDPEAPPTEPPDGPEIRPPDGPGDPGDDDRATPPRVREPARPAPARPAPARHDPAVRSSPPVRTTPAPVGGSTRRTSRASAPNPSDAQ